MLQQHAADFSVAHIDVIGPLDFDTFHPTLQGFCHSQRQGFGQKELTRRRDAARTKQDAKKKILSALCLPNRAALPMTGSLEIGGEQDIRFGTVPQVGTAQAAHGGVGLGKVKTEHVSGIHGAVVHILHEFCGAVSSVLRRGSGPRVRG